MKPQNLLNLDPSTVTARLGLCAAALAGTAAAVPSAQADIITFTPGLAVPITFAGVYINLETGVTGGSGGATPGWDFNPYAASGLTQLGFYWGTGAGGVGTTTTGPYINLAPGATVSAASTFANAILGTTGSPFLMTGTHILGFRFVNAAATTNYGYMVMTNTGGGATTGMPMTIVSWSFDNTGAPITVPIPEPTTAALLSIAALVSGAAGLRQWRRQRAA